MEEAEVMKKIEQLGRQLPHFPDGRIDFTNSDYAPVVTVFVKFQDEVLIVLRSDKVGNYQGKWNVITGYIDTTGSLKKKALSEVEEETGITGSTIKRIIVGEPFELVDSDIKKTWLVCSFILELDLKPKIKLDYENTEYRWAKPEELSHFVKISGLDKTYSICLKGISEAVT